MSDTCQHCGKPIRLDEQYVTWRAGERLPLFSLTLKLRAEWCANCDGDEPKITILKTPAKIP